jgi:catechol 2,3-dioxygenase-like lactoylglutathione lyase family enzyme
MSTSAATPVTGVDFVNVPITDLDRARRFYGETLGLEESAVYQRGDAPPIGAEFETGTVTLAVVDMQAIGREFRASSVPIALRVDDVAAAREQLEARGVSFAADTLNTGVCHMAFFEDPDGNSLMLHRRYAPRR